VAENNDGQERTERASPRRLQKAREEGTIPRSRELTSAALMLAGAGGLLLLGGQAMTALRATMTRGLNIDRARIFDETAMMIALAERLLEAVAGIAPLIALLVVVALAAPAAIGGWMFNPSLLAFKGERVDPVKGMKRVFSVRGLMEMLKAFAKFALVALVALLLLWHFAPDLLALAGRPVKQGLAHSGSIIAWSLLAFAGALALVAAVDVPYQLWQHQRDMRMTRQEVRDEFKETEGRPEVKSKVRQLQQEMARRRMMADVPRADVIVTNPTHYAVALKYDQGRHRAPVVVAKGADRVAAEIRRIAQEARVPRLEAKMLARALYYSTDIGREIPEGLYHAVARVLAYVYQLRHAAGGYVAPPPAEELPVPPDLRRA
jgi:flagellar biosynthetic protein FlhB